MLNYAEIHYRPPFVPSLIFEKQPEIIFDTPSRIDQGYPIPVFLLIKDADRFSVTLESVFIHVMYESGIEKVARFPYDSLVIDLKFWWDSFNILPEFPGKVIVDPYLFYTVKGKARSLRVDNYRGLSHAPLVVNVSRYPYPGVSGWYHGDIHCHSSYTSDQVEFGAPMEVTAFAAYCMGMHWIAVADHSYDLDDTEDDYKKNDPLLLKWHMMRKKAEMLVESVTVIPGEEVTCRNKRGGNCHLLALDARKFFKGSGDSGEKGLDTTTEKSVAETVLECVEWGGFACAAHPLEHVPFMERLFLKRDTWTEDDMETLGLSGLQVNNGLKDRGFKEGLMAWKRLLLKGKRVYIYGGSDSHGDMNRSRYILFPFLAVAEGRDHILGGARTVVRAQSGKTGDIVDALKHGNSVVTNGPFIDLSAVSHGITASPGNEIKRGMTEIHARFLSSPEFGSLLNASIFAGRVHEEHEQVVARPNSTQGESIFDYHFETVCDTGDCRYIRAECTTTLGKQSFTNPIWMADK